MQFFVFSEKLTISITPYPLHKKALKYLTKEWFMHEYPNKYLRVTSVFPHAPRDHNWQRAHLSS